MSTRTPLSIWIPALLIAIATAIGCTAERERTAGQANAVADTAASDTMASEDTTYRVDRVITPAETVTGRGGAGLGRILPVDEGDQDPELLSYMLRLTNAVGRRDTSALYDLMAENIHISFGTASGRAGFREMWSPAHPESEVWARLGQVIGGGGLYEEGSFQTPDGRSATARFTAPYYFAAFPADRLDPFQHGVIVDGDVAVREDPSPSAPTIDTLSYAIVRVPNFQPYEGGQQNWIRVALGDDRFGYVPDQLIASPIGYRAVFNKVGGDWEMSVFVAGD